MRNLDPIEKYLKEIEETLKNPQAQEHTYRPALKNLLEALSSTVKAFNEPKHIECGAPDFVVEQNNLSLGYIETKNIGIDLDKAEKSEQLKRYLKSLNNLILTDYLEFRWYVQGEQKLTIQLATVGKGKKLVKNLQTIPLFQQMMAQFYQTKAPTIATPKELATCMAQLTKLVQELIVNALQNEPEEGTFHKQYRTFQEILLPNLLPSEFADMYAQTIAYGLFAAKVSAPNHEPFNRKSAYQYLSKNHFLSRLFLDMAEELDQTLIAPFLDDIAILLEKADIAVILKEFGKRTRTEDPVVHFYETFLTAYNPHLRERRGVYYTPEPAVQFIVQSVDWLLRNRFDLAQGLATEDVYLLDPATGTSTFLYFVIQVIYDGLIEQQQAGIWQTYVHENLLPRLFGFELLVAPYVVAHLKLGLLLQELGYEWSKDDRLRVFLTNTLDNVQPDPKQGGWSWYLSQESVQANEVKNVKPIMVVLGNPPYSGHSSNKGQWIGDLVRDYYFINDIPLGERNPKWLQDDYVKFIRFAQWRIEQTGHGMVAFITNHGYLDNPTFRGMRYHLLKTFDEIYVLDLHGNSKKQECLPTRDKDENVFDIQQGVAILLAVKLRLPTQKEKDRLGQLFHAHLWGTRESKYHFLAAHDVSSLAWSSLQPSAPFFLFTPQDSDLRAEYEQGVKITDVMPVHSAGIVTARDSLTIHWAAENLLKTVREFASLPVEEARAKYGLGEDTRDWKVALAQKDIETHQKNKEVDPSYVTPILYRPFDIRYTYYTGQTRGFICMPRTKVMNHILVEKSLSLLTCRQQSVTGFYHVLCADTIVEGCAVSLQTREITSVFPLYLYETPETNPLFAKNQISRIPNLSPAFVRAFCQKLGLNFISDGAGDLLNSLGPEDIFHYAYAVFHSPTYRQRYAEFLKIDFPRLPLTSNRGLFASLITKGRELVQLHLMKSSELAQFITGYPVAGNHRVEKVRYEEGNVWINDQQYFSDLPEAIWTFRVGGYQVCDKWLKDRKGRTLNLDEIAHYQRIIVALQKTAELMVAIDQTIPKWPIM